MNLKDLMIDKSWTLFLDRDGVINRRIVDGYVHKWEEFEFLPGVLDSIKIFAGIFGRIIVVSNQQGIGKGLMTENELTDVHSRMVAEIEKTGGRIDGIYHCPFLEKDHSFLRKPSVGMALKARKDFPEIHFRKSVMAGDSLSDMLFGKRLKMYTVFLCDDKRLIRKAARTIDGVSADLQSFSKALTL